MRPVTDPEPRKGSTRTEHWLLVISLCALVVGLAVAMIGMRWGFLIAWAATAVGIGILTFRRLQGRI